MRPVAQVRRFARRFIADLPITDDLTDDDRAYVEWFNSLSRSHRWVELGRIARYDPNDEDLHLRARGIVTLREAAEDLGVTPDNLRGAIKRGTLRAEKHGRDWFVESADVERYRREHRRTA